MNNRIYKTAAALEMAVKAAARKSDQDTNRAIQDYYPGRLLERMEAEPDALAYLGFPPSHLKRLRTNNLQERASREIRRRSRMVQVLPPVASPERLAGAVMCDQDEAWSRSRCFSERVMSELPDEPGARETAAPTGEQLAAFRLVARRAIEVGLELADELEAA